MKKNLLLFILLFLAPLLANATNLTQVYQQALLSDPTYQQAIAQQLSTSEGVPIALSSLLPSFSGLLTPATTRVLTSGSGATTTRGSVKARGYTLTLTLSQTIFDFSKFTKLAGALATSKQANATLNAAAQSLITRVSSVYFQVLLDQDTLLSSESSKAAFAKQLDQVTQQYKVGLKTITDVYTAQASYQSSVASYIAAQNQLANDKENLRAITGVFYPHLDKLSEKFPLISPQPANIESWVTTTLQQNWEIKAAQYTAEAARQNIKQQFAGHLPSLTAEDQFVNTYTDGMGGSAPAATTSSTRSHTSIISLDLTIPIVAGGAVIAQTRQAQYDYQIASQKLEKSLRSTVNSARQSYLGVIAGISKISADKQAVKSSRSSFEGMEEGYRVGTQTLVDVLNQEQKVFQAEVQYATDRYAYVNNLLALKQAAGTLSPKDLEAINSWLEENTTVSTTSPAKVKEIKQSKKLKKVVKAQHPVTKKQKHHKLHLAKHHVTKDKRP